jgi:hypothetical protein
MTVGEITVGVMRRPRFNMHVSFIVENNVSMLQYLDINNTKEGITVTSSNAMLNNVSSSFSLANGIYSHKT